MSDQNLPKLTKEQALIITGFTGIMAVDSFGDFHEDVAKRLGRSIFTHEFPALKQEIKDAYEKDFMTIVYR